MSRPYTVSETLFVMDAYARNVPLADIASKLGRSDRSVSQHHSKHERFRRIRARRSA